MARADQPAAGQGTSCAPWWMIDGAMIGRCKYFIPDEPCGRAGGQVCPFRGQRDFGKLEVKLPWWSDGERETGKRVYKEDLYL